MNAHYFYIQYTDIYMTIQGLYTFLNCNNYRILFSNSINKKAGDLSGLRPMGCNDAYSAIAFFSASAIIFSQALTCAMSSSASGKRGARTLPQCTPLRRSSSFITA